MRFRDLILSASGKAVIVIGGGMDAPLEFERARKAFPEAVLISVNEHGFKLAECDYVACLDEIQDRLRKDLKIKAPLISYHSWSDYRIIEYPICSNSGNLATWVAWNLGGCPILLCGFDCYTKGTYFHSKEAVSPGTRVTLESHLFSWKKMKRLLPEDAPVRSMGGPLVQLFPLFDPKEDFSGYSMPDRHYMLRKESGKVVKITRSARIGPESYSPGQVVELCRRDAQHLIDRRRAVPASVSL